MTGAGVKTEASEDLAAISQRARRLYAECVAQAPSPGQWWNSVIVTANSQRQADRYLWELHRRQYRGTVPGNTDYLVVPDTGDQRIGSGGATINALRCLISEALKRQPEALTSSLDRWWNGQKVLVIHSGGDSRRLPQYSLSGKLFSVLPVKAPWGEVSTIFDEMLALSTLWAQQLQAGLVVGSGDVVLTFDAARLRWHRRGVCGVAMLQPSETGSRHGVYVADERGRIYAFLQKPSEAGLRAAGGLLAGGQVALDTGLLYFDPSTAARLTRLAGVKEVDGTLSTGPGIFEETGAGGPPPTIDLYEHVTKALTGQWTPASTDPPALHALADALKGVPFWCSIVTGDFTHIGTTTLFRQLMTEETEFSRLYAVQQRLGTTQQRGLKSAGVVIDSVLSGGGEVGSGALAIECNLSCPVHVSAGAVLHGVEGIEGGVEAPEDTVIHQIPVALPNGQRGVVIRVYGVSDDPKASVTSRKGTLFGRAMIAELENLGIAPEAVWPGFPEEEWTLWNAQLFPITTVEEAWACARWLLGLSLDFSVARWMELPRLSLATSAEFADGIGLESAHSRRLKAGWQTLAVSLVAAGADLRPILAHAPGIGPLAETGYALVRQATALESSAPTEAAHYNFGAGLFFGQAGLEIEAEQAREAAFRMVHDAVQAGCRNRQPVGELLLRYDEVSVVGAARIDLGGGWSDTPPFCQDWGGTVLNMAVELNGCYPIGTVVRRLREPVVRCISGEPAETGEYRDCRQILEPAAAGDPLALAKIALQLTGLFRADESLASILMRIGGGIEVKTSVDLPIGSGLGTSSILAATTLRAVFEFLGIPVDNQQLSDYVMRLEQLLTTGGGWQDQAGGIYPGAKLIVSGPGLHQRLRVQPVAWPPGRSEEFERLMVLYYTGLSRMARGLLKEVVGSYLARETDTVQALHSIKTLAVEMSYAITEGEWEHLGQLLDRHWALNQTLDPNTTNAPISGLLHTVRPYISGAKLAGAGGGGFLILMARDQEAAGSLRQLLEQPDFTPGGALYNWRIARDGLRITTK